MNLLGPLCLLKLAQNGDVLLRSPSATLPTDSHTHDHVNQRSASSKGNNSQSNSGHRNSAIVLSKLSRMSHEGGCLLWIK
jgi:hypothetical protein